MFSKSKIESLQLALKSLELYNGDIDGIVGPVTLSATKKFEALMVEKPYMSKPPAEAPIPDITKIDTIIDQPGSHIDEALTFTLKNEGGGILIIQRIREGRRTKASCLVSYQNIWGEKM
ncbi:peptidoglycan-binding domain-containing protein [Klebsiella spallanzanii]|uniref:peptidoglycan-binding domain-containing protein n=1 Tax=Klebsiella spallanzanii TaxID=2587528 RepID=UPI001158EAF7|nr:hypothetical protein [Klebsiella spallanzanii]VUS99241.1 hypothetical protein SB6419_05123 [Klebsiella spallanzanii]